MRVSLKGYSGPLPQLVALQAWLFITAQLHANRVFSLSNQLWRDDVLLAAANRLRRAKGKDTPGADGLKFADIDQPGCLARGLRHLGSDLRAGEYQPDSLRHVSIKRPDGGRRVLAIPTVFDRLIQHVLLLLLEPLAEAELPRVTFACRPGLGPHHALRALEQSLAEGASESWMIRADISKYFDRVPHWAIRALLARRLRGTRLWNVIERQLLAWEKYKGLGIPQGAPLSPLLANWLLADIDHYFASRSGVAYVRYLDDFVFVINGDRDHAVACLNELKRKLAALGLRLSGRKTKIEPAAVGVNFLGVHIRRGDQREVVFAVTERSVAELRRKIGLTVSGGSSSKKCRDPRTATEAWLAYFAQYDPDGVEEALRSIKQLTRLKTSRKSGRYKNGLKRKLPVWMRGVVSHRGVTPGTSQGITLGSQPPPGSVAQKRALLGGEGESNYPPPPSHMYPAFAWLPEEPPGLEALPDHVLRHTWGEFKSMSEHLGGYLQEIQEQLHQARVTRRSMYERARQLETDSPPAEVAAVRASLPEYRKQRVVELLSRERVNWTAAKLARTRGTLRTMRAIFRARQAAQRRSQACDEHRKKPDVSSVSRCGLHGQVR